MVRAIDVRTIGLGGDSEITLHANGRIQVGPQRVAPVSLVAARYPQVLALLRQEKIVLARYNHLLERVRNP